jgi:RNA 2',3'-cyclic 3'-phosphodiesterase
LHGIGFHGFLRSMKEAKLEKIRSFIAIELSEEIKTGLKQLQDRLKAPDPSIAKWVDPHSIHLTLKFLGYVDADKIAAIIQSIHAATTTVNPFALQVDGLGSFPSPDRVQVIWVGLIGDLERLQVLQENIELYVAPLGFPTEKRRFTAHLTLARVRESVTPFQRQALGKVIAGTQTEPNLPVEVNSISLMRSRLTPAGAIYTKLSSVELKSPC